MSKKLTLTPASLDALKKGSIADPQTPGLYIEALSSGKRVWKFRRRIPGVVPELKDRLGLYPATTIAAAREWARGINEKIDAGVDPRDEARAQQQRETLTVDRCHEMYMEAVRLNQHRTRRSQTAKPIKPRTITEKQAMYDRNVSKVIGSRWIGSIEQADLTKIIIAMSVRSPVQANRTGAELRVFFSWCCGLRGQEKGIELPNNPSAILGDLWNPEETRDRWLDHDELPLFLKALAGEERTHRRALLMLLLTGCRRNEVMGAPMSEFRDGVWTIPGSRVKNGQEHPITLGPWGRKLAETNSEWLVPSSKLDDGPMMCGWPKVIERVRARMSEIGGRDVEHFTPHDLRRTMRSHVEDHDVDELTAERMVNHLPVGLIKIYNRNKRAGAMAEGFAKWDAALAGMAVRAGVGEALEVVTKAVEPQPTHALPNA